MLGTRYFGPQVIEKFFSPEQKCLLGSNTSDMLEPRNVLSYLVCVPPTDMQTTFVKLLLF